MKLKQLIELKDYLEQGNIAEGLELVESAMKDNIYAQWQRKNGSALKGEQEPLPGIPEEAEQSPGPEPLEPSQVWALVRHVDYRAVSSMISSELEGKKQITLAREIGVSQTTIGRLHRRERSKLAYKVVNALYASLGDAIFYPGPLANYREGLKHLAEVDKK